jgi:dTDP-4-dehydrorhamnose reductase
MDRILVIGAGLLGSRLIAQSPKTFELHSADIDAALSSPGCQFHNLDIADKKAVNDLILSLRPTVVFHTAAMTDVDRCEIEMEQALKVNGTASGHIALACAKVNAFLCYISTDYVFGGRRGNYTEEDVPTPINQYGRSKLLGEQEVSTLKSHLKWTICRSSILYGVYKKRFNFVTWVIDELTAGRAIRVVTDQTASPTLADDLADACLQLWRKDARGLYHVAGREPISRFDFAMKICEVFGLDKGFVKAVTTEQLKQKAIRPANSSMDVANVEGFLGRRMLDIREGLERMKGQWGKIPERGMGPKTRTA